MFEKKASQNKISDGKCHVTVARNILKIGRYVLIICVGFLGSSLIINFVVVCNKYYILNIWMFDFNCMILFFHTVPYDAHLVESWIKQEESLLQERDSRFILYDRFKM